MRRALLPSLSLAIALAGAGPDARAQTLFESYAVPGPWTPGWTLVDLPTPGGALPVRLDYPALDGGGAGSSPDTAGGPWPLLAFGHGGGLAPEAYGAFLELVASWGFVVVSPGTALDGPLEALAGDLALALDAALLASTEGTAPLAGLLDATRIGAFGHSMGAGAALVMAADRPDVGAVVALAPWDAPPALTPLPPSQAVAALAAPLLVVVGGADDVTPPATDAWPIYEAALATTRLREIVIVPGAGHNGPQSLFDVAADAGVAFLRAYLIDEHPALDHVYGPYAQAQIEQREITFELRAPECFVTGTLAPGAVVSTHLGATPGAPTWLLLGVATAPGPPPLPCLGIALAGGSFFELGPMPSGQLLSLDVGLPPGLVLPPGVPVFVQTLALEPQGLRCSDVRELVTP